MAPEDGRSYRPGAGPTTTAAHGAQLDRGHDVEVRVSHRRFANALNGSPMSNTLVRAVFALPKDALPASARYVLTALAWHCNELAVQRADRSCWPSLNTLARETSLDRTTCMRAVELLERRHFVEVDRRQRVGNRYRLTDPKRWPGSKTPARGGIVQPTVAESEQGSAGGITQPDRRVTPPEEARKLLRQLVNLVGRRDHRGGVVRPEQDRRCSEQVRLKEADPKQPEGRTNPPHRSREEQLAYVAAAAKKR
jgi:hypothetical protein